VIAAEGRRSGQARATSAIRGLAGVALAALVIAACSPSAPPPARPGEPAASAASTAPSTPPPLEQVKTTYASAGLSHLPIYAAQQLGFFARNGLEVEAVLMGSERALPAVAAGELHYMNAVGANTLGATVAGLPLRAVWISASRSTSQVFTRPETSAPAQLRGKRIAVGGLSNSGTATLELALQAYDVDMRTDIVLLALDNEELRLESLRNGAVEAVNLIAPATRATARREGFPLLLDVGNAVKVPSGGLSTTLDKLTTDRDQVQRMIRANVQAQQWIIQNRAEAVQMIVEVLKTEPAIAELEYEDALTTFEGHGLVSREGIDNILTLLRGAGRIGPEVRYEDVADGSVAEAVVRALGLTP
jgi:NitT/TauT family transport system substrate-binding protein